MSHVRGMIIRLRTGTHAEAGTNDHLYIGVKGTSDPSTGAPASTWGREFPLATQGFNDFSRNTDVFYVIGDQSDMAAIGATIPGSHQTPDRSLLGQANDPGLGDNITGAGALHGIELPDVTEVYLRKQGDRTHDGDNEYQLEYIHVQLWGIGGPRNFHVPTDGPSAGVDIWLGNEYGHTVWLQEI